MAEDRLMIRLEPELKQQLEALAKGNNQNLSAFIREQLGNIAQGKNVIQKQPKAKTETNVVIQKESNLDFERFKRLRPSGTIPTTQQLFRETFFNR